MRGIRRGTPGRILEALSDIELPTIELGARYNAAKVEYGMVENDESVFGYGLTLGEFSARATYVYKSVFDEDESDAQEIAVAGCRLAVDF